MKVLVTGGTGFVGRHLVWHLAHQGHEVIFTGRRPAAASEVLDQLPPTAQVQWQALNHGQAGAKEALRRAAEGADALIHCAALSSPWGRAQDFYHANVASTDEVLAACDAEQIACLVHISTPSIYFDFRDRELIHETQPLPTPVNDYVRTKRLAEEQVIDSNQIPKRVILRPRAIFGPWDNTLMPRLLRAMARGPLPLMREGRALLDLTYIDNLIHAIELALTKPLPKPLGIYNLSNAEPLSLRDLLIRVAEAFQLPLRTRSLPWPLVRNMAYLLEVLAKINGREPLLTRYSAGVLAFSQTLDISAIRQDLGYNTRVSLEEGIYRHAHWFLAHTHQELPL